MFRARTVSMTMFRADAAILSASDRPAPRAEGLARSRTRARRKLSAERVTGRRAGRSKASRAGGAPRRPGASPMAPNGTAPRSGSKISGAEISEQRGFHVGKVPEARPVGALVVLRAASEKTTRQAIDRAVGVDRDEENSPSGEMPPDRLSETGEILDVRAVDQVKARQDLCNPPSAGEDEGMSVDVRRAPEA